jgi:hypothetical protein
MSEENKPAESAHEGGSPSEGSSAKEAPARSERASEPAPHFDHARAWDEAFKAFAKLPEDLLNALAERATTKKEHEKEPEERVVHQTEEKIESPTPGKKGGQNAEAQLSVGKRPWGARFLGHK